ncbi:serine integrase family protein [Mangrovicoccus ximenensis]|uniref:recombinase family protein n=1 Tax=Mangrovicoccus ximenensis TaxID=1911570 RepID=UPI00191BF4A2|nr:recombinase family protein [Mangrovicoccus ximenensis]
MAKTGPDHLGREAVVHVRQSTQDQILHNHESRRQYALADRARQLGWDAPVVIDDDLGRSGGGIVGPGFERLLPAICEGRVGLVLARNGRDWHTLLEFCGLVGGSRRAGRALRSAPPERPPPSRHERAP